MRCHHLSNSFRLFCRSTKQIPNYLENQDALRVEGIDKVVIYCVNDAAVMQAWGKDQKVGLVRDMRNRLWW